MGRLLDFRSFGYAQGDRNKEALRSDIQTDPSTSVGMTVLYCVWSFSNVCLHNFENITPQ